MECYNNKVKCKECEEKDQYIKNLKQEIQNLERELKITEEDRDEAKLGLQKMIARYTKLITKKG